jgi:hypothetical protein
MPRLRGEGGVAGRRRWRVWEKTAQWEETAGVEGKRQRPEETAEAGGDGRGQRRRQRPEETAEARGDGRGQRRRQRPENTAEAGGAQGRSEHGSGDGVKG